MAQFFSKGGSRARSYRAVGAVVVTAVVAFTISNRSIGKQQTPPRSSVPAGVSQDMPSRPRSATAQAAIASLQSASERFWNVRWGRRTGLPRTLAGGRSGPYTGEPAAVAASFLTENAALFGLDTGQAQAASHANPTREQKLPNAVKVSFAQTAAGLPVFGTAIDVIVDGGGHVRHVSSSAVELPTFNVSPKLDPAKALEHAATQLPEHTGIKIDEPSRLVVYPSDPPRLAYEVYLSVTVDYDEPWLLVIDADDGSLVVRRRLVLESGATRVFCPNPVVTLLDVSLRDQNDSNSAVPEPAYYEVQLENLDPPVDGLYSLKGTYVWLMDLEIPTNIPPTSPDGVFSFWRADDEFEEVMAYYTIDRSQAYIQSLGFLDINNRVQVVDARGFFFFDNSRYDGVPVGAGRLFFGVGGVDDAEDADIILHEYGHAIQDNSAPGIYFGEADNGYGNETGAMAEGFADYWAAASGYDTSVARGFPPEFVAEWDAKGYAGGPQHYLRIVNSSKIYPHDMVASIHADGEIWSAALWDIFLELGGSVTNRIVLYSHFLVAADPDFADGAQALIDADALLYPVDLNPGDPIVGVHYNTICAAMSTRGILTCFPICSCSAHGDPVGDGFIDVLDIGFILDEVVAQGPPATHDPLCLNLSRSDYNCDHLVDVLDIGYAVDYVFQGGDAPCNPCDQ